MKKFLNKIIKKKFLVQKTHNSFLVYFLDV